jgi:hypothetical protein
VNPRVKMVIKYPNWYGHYQQLGYNLEDEPRIFDGIYAGTETRDSTRGNQHLQPYLGYGLIRYFENIKPGGSGGGWVDTGGWRDKERYGEQLWLTLFAKAPEMTLFDFRQLLAPMRGAAGGETIPGYAGSVFAQVDSFIGKLGTPVGVKSYKPYHSSGEDFLHDYLGMLGIPVEMTPAFPIDAPVVLLTETAKFDPAIVGKMKKHLMDGKKVVITSGLLKALQGKGIEDIAEVECTGLKAAVHEFPARGASARIDGDMIIPQIRYATNDAWEIISTATQGIGYPFLLQAGYAKGQLYVLTIPDNFGDLYRLPPQVMNQIRTVVAGDLPVRIEGPTRAGLFVYDNAKFIVENFAEPGGESMKTSAVLDKKYTKLVDLISGQAIAGQARGDKMVFELVMPAASYRVLGAE